jgi:hypothetical protein
MAKRCNNCGNKFTARFKTTERYCWEPDCKTIEAMEHVRKQREKQAKDRETVSNAISENKQRKTLSYLKTSVMTVCHDYIKLRDKGKPCVSCGEPWHKDHQAGHWKSAGSYAGLRFDERNIHNQCEGCNIHKRGNVEKYADRIHLRIGYAGKEALEKAAVKYKHSAFKWERSRLVAIRKYYQEKIKSLKKVG